MNKRGKRKLNEALSFTGFTAPALLLISVFVIIPFLSCIYFSFMKWNGVDKAISFNKFNNYIQLFTNDPTFKGAFLYTMLYMVLVVVLVNVCSLLAALLLESKIRGKGIFRAAFYIPNIISLILIGFIWKFLFGRVFDSLGAATGWEVFNLSYLGDPHLSVISTVLVTVWQSLGFYMIIYIAGLQSVPADIIEAARIDGAGPIRRFFSITFPMIMPSVTVCTFYSIANSLKMFELIFSLTGGGPGTATTSISLDIYNTAFNNNQFGYGSAKSVVLFLIVAVITVWQVTAFKKREVEA